VNGIIHPIGASKQIASVSRIVGEAYGPARGPPHGIGHCWFGGDVLLGNLVLTEGLW